MLSPFRNWPQIDLLSHLKLKPRQFQSYLNIFLISLSIFFIIFLIQGCTLETHTWNRDPSWSPDSTKIVFDSDRDNDYTDIYSMDADGNNQARLTNSPKGDWSPKFSPDGTKIVYAYGYTPVPAPTTSSIYVMDADGSNQTRITNAESYPSWSQSDDNPEWSPDGLRIVFTSTRVGSSQIYVMNADGTIQTRLTNDEYWNEDPTWSPDGSKIAFSSRRNGASQIYVMNADGSQQANLTTNPANDYDQEPSWSPDGTRIGFSSIRDGNFEIYVMNADGGEQTRLTNNPKYDGSPAWSPDGSKIAFVSDRGGTREIYVMNVDGSDQIRLTGKSPLLSLGNLFLVALLATIVSSIVLPLRRRRLLGKSEKSEFALVSLVTGIIGILGSPSILWGFAIPIADVLSIIFGVLAIRQTGRKHIAKGRRIAIAGLISGIVGFLIFFVIIAIMIIQSLKYIGLHY